ncbi:MAG TPA: hypothetical protein VHD63_22020, partial [Ktedonobacteraceae bacterium]|nr:hypothetical protein [Ktedonobacteraceae bacterium]
MSTPAQLLHDLASSGIQVVLQNGRVHVSAPQGALTPDLRWRLRESRDDLQCWLSLAEQAEPALDAPASPVVTTSETFLPTIVSLARAHCARPGRVAIDLETTGLDARRHKVVSIALGMPGHVTILDLRPYYTLPEQEQARWREALRHLLHYGGITWIGQNLKFDWQFLAAHFNVHLDTV